MKGTKRKLMGNGLGMLQAMLITALMLTAGMAMADDYTWTGGGTSGVWNDADNWDLAGYPDGNTDTALIDSGDEAITVPAGKTLGELTLATGYSGTVSMAGNLLISDGGGESGNLTVNAGTLQTGQDTESGITVDGDFSIGSNGVVVMRRKDDTAGTHGEGQTIAADSMTVDGWLHADGHGFDNNPGPGVSADARPGGSYGGHGATREAEKVYGPTYGSVTNPTALGSRSFHSSRGNGGGAILITLSGGMTVNGTVSANGVVNLRGGSGGSVNITAASLSGTGTIAADGGNGDSHGDAGGGGRIALKIDPGTDFGNVHFQAYGGVHSSNAEKGSAGTIYLEHANHDPGKGILKIDNDDRVASTFSFTELSEDGDSLHAFDTVVITNNAKLAIRENDTLDFGQANIVDYGTASASLDIFATNGLAFPADFVMSTNYTLRLNVPVSAPGNWTMPSGAVLSHYYNHDTEVNKLTLSVGGNLTIETGAEINVDAKGFNLRQGPGAWPSNVNSGGSHGGRGSVETYGVAIGDTYGSVIDPVELGSGGNSDSAASRGGGAVILNVTGVVTNWGTISANGGAGGGKHSRGGSGGSVNISAAGIGGDGIIRAISDDAPRWHGGGGRVAVKVDPGIDFGDLVFQAHSAKGAAGTVYLEHAGQSGSSRMIVNDLTAVSYTNIVTDLPSYRDRETLANELRTTTLIVTNRALVNLTTNVTVGDLYLKGLREPQLYLNGHTLRVLSVYHEEWGSPNLVDYSGGEIVWLSRGTILKLR